MAPRKAIIISTHILEEVDTICTQTLIINRGNIVFTGTPRGLSSLSEFHNALTIIMLRDDAEKFKNETKDIVESSDLNEELRGNEAKLTYKLQDGNLQEDEMIEEGGKKTEKKVGLNTCNGRYNLHARVLHPLSLALDTTLHWAQTTEE